MSSIDEHNRNNDDNHSVYEMTRTIREKKGIFEST